MSPVTESTISSFNSYHGLPEGQSQGVGEKPVSQSKSQGVLTPKHRKSSLNNFVDTISNSKHRMEFFHKEECLYSQDMYVKAGRIYDALKQDSEADILKKQLGKSSKGIQNLGQLDFENETEKRLTFELAFSTLKYQSLFDEILEECSFYHVYPELEEDNGTVMVVLYDHQQRKFQFRTPFSGEILIPLVNDVEKSILDSKTKLNAAIARHRIKASARSLEFLLPDNLRRTDEAKDRMPAYFWINQLKTTQEDVISMLRGDGYRVIANEDGLGEETEKVFAVDHHCSDLLVFPASQVKYLQDNQLVDNGLLVRQDKSSCLAPHSVKYLLNDDDDVIHVNAGSGLTSAHIASLLKNTKSHVLAFGAANDSDAYRIHKNLVKLGVGKSVKVVQDPFLQVDPDDSKFKSARVMLVTADCSKSAVTNPVEFVVSEGEDMTILRDLSGGTRSTVKMSELHDEHIKLMRHAMKFTRIQAVVYMTRSVHSQENEVVVDKTIEYINMVQNKKLPFRLVPPVLAFSASEIENNNGICGKYMKFKPSHNMNGCFVAVITREPEDLKESSKDVIARANAKGLLKTKSGDSSEALNSTDQQKRKRKKKGPAPFKPILSSRMQIYVKSSPSLKQSIKLNRVKEDSRPQLQKSLSTPLEKIVPEHVRVVKHPAPFR